MIQKKKDWKKNDFWCYFSKSSKILNFNDFLNREKAGKTSSSILSQFPKTLSFQALEKDVLEKYPTNQKK